MPKFFPQLLHTRLTTLSPASSRFIIMESSSKPVLQTEQHRFENSVLSFFFIVPLSS